MKKLIIWVINIFLTININYAQDYINLNLDTPHSGTYTFVAKESITLSPGFQYTANGTDYFQAEIDPLLVNPDPYPEDKYGGSNNGVVGGSGISVDVSPSGAAMLEFPVKLTPGTAGLAPQLSIVYNSHGTDGLLGVGFTLSGLSSISRSGKTIINDGIVTAVEFNDNDRFLLDGNRLINVNGNYGQNNTVYRTENNTFSKIISYTPGAYGPERFEVFTKSGLIYEYGGTTDSRFKAQNSDHIITWLVNKVTDTKGNYYTITYNQDNNNGEYHPVRIDYTGNANASPELVPYNSVRFEYEYRYQCNRVYIKGNKSKVSRILKRIKIFQGEDLIKQYRLDYIVDEFYKYLLSSVTESGQNDEELNPVLFDWYSNSELTHEERIYDQTSLIYKADIITGDFNGDGQTDFIATPKPNAGWTGWRLFLANASGTQFIYSGSGTLLEGFLKLYAGDFNGDGKTDIVQCRSIGGVSMNYWVQFSTGTGFTNISGPAFFTENRNHEVMVGEFNGDGISDIFVYYPLIRECKIIRSGYYNGEVYPLDYIATRYLPSGINWERAEMVDFNGDGLSDVMNLHTNGYVLMESDGYGTMSVARNQTWPKKKHHINFGDFNGDGKTDMLITGYDSDDWSYWQLHFSTGMDFEANSFYKKFNSSQKKIFTGDINGDGREDFFAIDIDRDPTSLEIIPLYIACGDGSFFIYKEGARAYSLRQWSFFTGDYNGDGRMDYFFISAQDTWNGYKLYTVPSFRDNLLMTVTDELGNETNISYKALTDDNVYLKFTDGEYPLIDIEGAFQVVDSIIRPDGTGGTRATTYQYEGAKFHKRGRGFLGFSKFVNKDTKTGIENVSVYEFETSVYASGLNHSITRLPGDNIVSRSDYTNAVQNYETGIFTYMPAQVIERNYEIGSSTPHSTTTTTYSYDFYGNVLTLSRNYGNEATVTTTHEYDNDLNNWHLGRLKKATVIKASTGNPDITRVSTFEYDLTTGMLKKEIIEPDSQNFRMEKIYQHDVYGNIIKSTTVAEGDSVTLQSVFDTKGRFEIQTINSSGYTTIKEIHPYYGVVTTQTDPNGLVSTAEYDEFGRLFRSESPSGIRTISALRWCSNNEYQPELALYYSYNESSDGPPVIEFFDCMGRTLRKVLTGFDGIKIFTDTEYDDYGRIYRVSDPYFEEDTPQWTSYQYDVASRMVKTILPDNSEISVTYNGLSITTENPLGQTITKTTNQQGLLVNSEDDQSNSVIYTYNSAGNLIEIRDPVNNKIEMEYDILGNRTKLTHPNLGTVEYQYNAFGELIKQEDESENISQFEYDLSGRILVRAERDDTTTWTYDNLPHGIGKVSSIISSNGISQSFVYDNLGRPVTQTEVVNNNNYSTHTSYDIYGRVSEITYPAGLGTLKIRNIYNKYGYLEKVVNANSNKIYWTAGQINARGQVEQFTFGNGLQTTHGYNAITGMLESIVTQGTGGPVIRDWKYLYDALGNLIQRKDEAREMTEDFIYDNLNRLIKTLKDGNTTQTITYDITGNIINKSDIGDYNYGTPGGKYPHAVQSITPSFGSIQKMTEQAVTYTSFNKVASICQGDDSLVFTYGVGHERKIVERYHDNVLTKKKIYIGSSLEIETNPGTGETIETRYIFAGGGAIAIHTVTSSGEDVKYLHKDHLGSVQCITNESGLLVQELSYDAWGNRRDPSTWVVFTSLPVGLILERGFTGHEHIDLFDLVNM